MHEPTEPARAHDWQVPLQAELQQKPCAQYPVTHSVPAVQGLPAGFSPQLPELQTAGATHCPFPLHVFRQSPPVPHWNGEQVCVPPGWQLPVPSHRLASVFVYPVHVCVEQIVPETYFRHAPVPSHIPSSPQLVEPSSPHSLSGSLPPVTGRHRPLPCPVFGCAHAWHVPAHADSQHTPSTQNPDRQLTAAVQVAPTAPLFRHSVPAQYALAAQLASLVQAVRQAVAPHAKGAHAVVIPERQLPPPLQVPAVVSLPALHVAATHTVLESYRRHAPAPSQVPSSPQPAAPWSAHWLSGSSPAGTGVQVPVDDGSAQDMQVPAQALEQHTPCWQCCESQSLSEPQTVPSGFLPHVPLTQSLGDLHWFLLVQPCRQSPAGPHR